MLAWYHIVLISAAVIAAGLAWNVPRAVLWVGGGAIGYAVSASWHNAGLPYATQFGAATNLVICYLFWIWAEQRWELRLWNFFHLMLVIDMIYIFGFMTDKFLFAASLEIVNLAALIFIGSVGILERAGGHSAWVFGSRWDSLVYRTLWAERSDHSRPPWQK